MRGRPLHLLRNVLIVPDTGTCSIVVGAGASSPPHHSSNCFQENVQDLERVNITYICTTLVGLYPACTINRDSRSIAILGVILMLLLREQITTFWRVYHLCTYKRCKKNAMSRLLSHFFATQYQESCENFAFILAPNLSRQRWYTLVNIMSRYWKNSCF